MNDIKKKVVLIPSAYNSKVMGDIENFIKYYKDIFDLYVLYDKNNKEENGIKYYNKDDKYANYLIYVADYIIDAGSINGKTRVCNTQKRISVWHGIPYKKMFIDLDKSYVEEALEYDYGVDLMVSPSKFYTEEFLRKSMLYNGEVLETAVSRTDSLFKNNEEKNTIKENLGIPLNKKVLLYAPTYRTSGNFELPFNPNKLLEKLNSKGKDEWILVVKLHYLNKLSNVSSSIVDCTSYPIVNDILAVSDMLITDYSSLFFDYSILDKPALFYQYDKESYEKDRGFMFLLDSYVDKKYIITKEDELINNISKFVGVKNLSKVKKEFYPYQKPDSTKELVKKINLDSSPRKIKDIIFLVNDLNQGGGVHNFIMNLAHEFKEKYNSRIFVFGVNEFANSNEVLQIFDKDNYIDVKLSKENDLKAIESILRNTDGYIISCQFWAHKSFERYLKDKNSFLMFHGDIKDVVSKNMYKWQLNALNNFDLYNYKELLLLTEGNAEILKKHLNNKIIDKVGYVENSFSFGEHKNYYKKNGEFALISRLDDDKNVFDAIKVFASKNINKSYKLHVYGDGKLRNEFEAEIKKLKLEKKIIVHGYCNDKDEMYKDKQGIILTSLSEGFALILLESTNYGIPTYLYNSFTALKEFKDYSTIKLVKTSDIEGFVDKLNNDTKFDTKDFYSIEEKFSNDTIVNKWLGLFDKIENEDYVRSSFKNRLKDFIKNSISFAKKKLGVIYRNYFKEYLLRHKKAIFDVIINLKYIKVKLKTLFSSNKPLVSIIVPFYNNLDTIDNLLKSIKKSGYKNYEVILVNDGSDEDPKDIISKYDRVKYFYKKNEGPGLTRNFALKNASGKYVFFIDSDDRMCKGALNNLVYFAEKNKLDMVSGLCRRINNDTKKATFWNRGLYKKNYINQRNKRYVLFNDTISTAKLYNLKELKKSKIEFVSGLYEDKLFMARIYKYFDKIGIINTPVYDWYVYGENTSITTTFDYNNVLDRIKKINEILEVIEEKYKTYYIIFAITHDLFTFINNYNYYEDGVKRKIYNLYREFLMNNINYVYLKNIKLPVKKEILNCIINDKFERFDIISSCVSYKIINDKLK